MMFDSKHLGLVDVAIAMEIANGIDDGQPKPKLSDAIRRGMARIMKRGENEKPVSEEQPCGSTAVEALNF